MTSTRNRPLVRNPQALSFRVCRWCVCWLLISWSVTALAADPFEIPPAPEQGGEAWLVTFGPGQIYWERFGHNAIWLREPALGLDHTFNFGFFDFEQEDFFLRFMRGRMLYFSVAQPADREFDFYRQQNRSIRVQKLNLSSVQYNSLRDHLLYEVRPENRDYRYDYYLNNCSTRIRDAIDIALDGALAERTRQMPASLNFREQTRRLTQMQFWYYLGLELGLGFPVDREVSRWDEMFVPGVVADELADFSMAVSEFGKPLLAVDTMLFTTTMPAPAEAPSQVWHRYLAFGLILTVLAWLSGKFMPPVWLAGLSQAWILNAVTIGLLLSALWLFTDHEVTRPNANLLLFNPLLALALLPALRRFGAVVLAGGVVCAAVLLVLPVRQYNLDVLALVAPVNLAVAAHLWRNSYRRGGA